jgi:hypothetical protein
MAETGLGGSVVAIRWVANPFRADRFEAMWAPIAERALDYGAHGYAFFRGREDQAVFTQLAWFDTKVDFERYWLSEEVADARVQVAGLHHVPVLPEWHGVVGFGSRQASPVSDGARG